MTTTQLQMLVLCFRMVRF